MFNLLRSWWQIDRVRASPREGRLLRLRPPCILVIDGRVVEVVARTLAHDYAGAIVSYDCRQGEEIGRLTIRLGGGATSDVSWTTADVERRFSADDVEVFAPSPAPSVAVGYNR